MKQIFRFTSLPPVEKLLLLKSALFLGVMNLFLFSLPFRKVITITDILQSKDHRTRNHPRLSSDTIAWAVKAASRYIPFTKCLSQALVTQIFLVREGHVADLRIGVTKDATKGLEAHAWVESQGQIVIGNMNNLACFKRLPSLRGEKA